VLSADLHTCSRENHIGYLRGHLREVGYFNNAPLPISIPFGEIPKNIRDCRLPNKDIVTLGEAWPCNSPVPSPFIVFTKKKVWAITELLSGFYDPSDLWKCCATLKDSLNRQIEHVDNHLENLVVLVRPTLVAVASASSSCGVLSGNSDRSRTTSDLDAAKTSGQRP